MTTRLAKWSWFAGVPVRISLVGLIRIYRLSLGQLLGGNCRFYPSCSTYAEQAIRELGWIRGVALSVWRILRCTPLSRGGVDYPPMRRGANHELAYDTVILEGCEAPTRAGVEGSQIDRWPTLPSELPA